MRQYGSQALGAAGGVAYFALATENAALAARILAVLSTAQGQGVP